MKRGKILLIVFIILLLPSIFSATENSVTEKTSDLQTLEKLQESIAYSAQEYQAGNTRYLQTLIKIHEAESQINTLLATSNSITPDDLKSVLGEPDSQTSQVAIKGEETQKQVDPTPVWANSLYSGELNVKENVIPVIRRVDGKEKLTYETKVSVALSEEQPNLDDKTMQSSISDLEKLAKEYNLNPTQQSLNTLAGQASTIQSIFNAYLKQSNEKCEVFFNKLLGEENIISDQRIVTKEITLFNDEEAKTLVTMSYSEKGKYYWINLDFKFKDKNGNNIDYLLIQDTSASLYADVGSDNEFKGLMLDSFNTFNDLISAGSYRAANTVAKKISVINSVWNEKANDDKTKSAERFIARLNFFDSLFENHPSTMTFTEQTTYEKTLASTITPGGSEICDNGIDDNNNGKIDCEDPLCNGQICKTNTREENGTINTYELYCIKETCQQLNKTETIVKNATCGNDICEEGEIQTCVSDCRKCPEYNEIECSGSVIYKGQDENGCSLEPICIKKTEDCSNDEDCEQPLCGKSQCIKGKCEIANLEQCTQEKCIDGEQRIQTCANGEKVITEICSNKVWVKTKAACLEPSPEPIDVGKLPGQSCETKKDCGTKESIVCSNGICRDIAKNKKEELGTESITTTAISFTGNVIEITGGPITGGPITGVVGEPDPNKAPDAYSPPIDYARKTETSKTGRSLFTVNLEPTQEESQALAKLEKQASSEVANSVDLSPEQKGAFVVRGVCTTTPIDGEKASLSFVGAGDNFNQVTTLKQDYDAQNPEWCKMQLGVDLGKRKEIENSLNDNFAEWVFENVAYDADNWETKKTEIEQRFNDIVNNQKDIAEMMDCAEIKELSSYNPITINFQNSYGKLEYTEKLQNVKLGNMIGEVSILSPEMKITIFPTEDFIKAKLVKAMQNHEFPGPSQESAERKLGNGLTSDERATLLENTELVKEIKDLSSKYREGLDVQFKLVDNKGQVVYNLYGILNDQDLIKAAPMLDEETPQVNTKITANFNSILEVIKQSEENSLEVFVLKAPWDNSIDPIRTITSLWNMIKMTALKNNMMGSIQITPDNPELKKIVENLFYIIAEKENQPRFQEKGIIFYTEKGTQLTID